MTTPASPVKSVTMSTMESRKGEKESIVDGLKSTAGGDYMNGIETEKIVDSASMECRVYNKRWIVLFLFVFYSMTNAFQWMQFCIISNQVTSFYGISSQMVDMTSMIYMFVYIPLIFPSSYLIEQKGLRIGVLLGSFGTAVGAWIKVFSANPNRWWVAFTGQTIVAVSQIFVLGIPPLLAALWFPSDQVSTATSIGVFGNQLGVAAGFLLPTMIVSNGTSEEIGYRLSIMYYGTGAVTAAVFVLAVFFFQDRPAKPPSYAQSALLSTEKENYIVSMKRLLTNKGYWLLLTSYGVNVGVFYAISTVLADFVLKYFPDASEDVGRIGLSIVLSGMVGSVISGLVLDKTRKYKETTLVLYMLSLVGMIAYTVTLPNASHIAWIYVVMASLGFFMTGYLPVGFEFAAEITYPESEGTSSGLLNAAAQVFGLILTPTAREVFQTYDSDVGANTLLCITLSLGLLMTALIKPDLRRLAAQEARTSLHPDNSNNSQIVPSLGSEEA